MIINGTMSEIKVQRTRNLLRKSIEVDCPDYRLEGEFPIYNRLEDFLWTIISKNVLPMALKEANGLDKKDPFLMDGEMLPATMTLLSVTESELSVNDYQNHYLLTCMDKQLTTTYHVWLTVNEELFRRSDYKFKVTDVKARVKDELEKTNREFTSVGITEEGFGAYKNLSADLLDLISSCIMIEFEGTDEEDDAMFYVIPRWVDKNALLIYTEKVADRYRCIAELPNGQFRASATFNLKIV